MRFIPNRLQIKLIIYGAITTISAALVNRYLHHKFYYYHPELIQNVFLHFLLSLVFILLVLASLWHYLRKKILKPLQKIIAADKKLVSGEKEAAIISTQDFPNNEIATVMQGRNQSLKHLYSLEAELQAQNQKLAQMYDSAREIFTLLAQANLEESILQKEIEALVSLTEAKYGAIVIADEKGEIAQFITAGIEEDKKGLIKEPPKGKGLLGISLKKGEVLNLEDLTRHPRFTAFPPGHPEMRTLLMAPIYGEYQYLGRVYLTEKKERKTFNYEDEKILLSFANSLALVMENIRLLKQIQEAEERYRTTIDLFPTPLLVVDENQNLILTNQKFRQVFTAPEETRDKNLKELLNCPELTQKLDEFIRQEKSLDHFGISLSSEKEDTIEFWVVLSALTYPKNEKEILIILEDVSEKLRCEREQQSVREQLFQAEKLSALGRLVAGVAHELNNPLAVIMGNAQLLLALNPEERTKRRIETINKSVERSKKIVQNLLSFAHQTPAKKTYTGVNGIIEDCLEFKAYDYEAHRIEVIKELEEKLPKTVANFHQLQQVFINILENGQQALLSNTGEKTMKIKTESKDGKIYISFKDNGPGIPPENLNRIFEPFFTTKEIGKGTGLGLSLAYGIIQEHGGKLWAESKEGQGVTFIIELPILEDSYSDVKPYKVSERASVEVSIEKKKILIVDDEREILDMIFDLLHQQGNYVDVASNGKIAWEKIQKQEYDLILCDIKMPQMDGKELYQALKKANPLSLRKLVFITGDTVSQETSDFLKSSGCPSIQKPFDIEELRQMLHTASLSTTHTQV